MTTSTGTRPTTRPGRVVTVATAIGQALVPVVFTSAGFAVGQGLHLSDVATYLCVAAATSVSALVGVAASAVRPGLREAGFRAPDNLRDVAWLLPVIACVVVVALTGGVHTTAPLALSLGWLATAVAVNEETWFRGIVLRTLRRLGTRAAVVGSAVLFGVLHLATLLGGTSPAYVGLQVVFAFGFGFVAALVAVRTHSLVPVIAWHFAHDFVSYLGGDRITPATLIGLAVVCATLLAYAVWLWRGLPRRDR